MVYFFCTENGGVGMDKIARTFFAPIMFVMIAFQLTSCSGMQYKVSGIENFSPGLSQCELTVPIIPEDFLELYPYKDGGFEYLDYQCDLTPSTYSDWYAYEVALLYMVYDSETYIQAKQYALEILTLDTEDEQEYCGYYFLPNYNVFTQTNEEMKFYFGYCDEQNVVIALGTRLELREYTHSSLEEYIAQYFYFYDFENVKFVSKPSTPDFDAIVQSGESTESSTVTETTTN